MLILRLKGRRIGKYENKLCNLLALLWTIAFIKEIILDS
jgi:hypothetical protein